MPAAAAAPRKPARRPATKAVKPPHPNFPTEGTPDYPLFWLYVWAVKVAELQALRDLRFTPFVNNRCRVDEITGCALAGAETHLQDEIRRVLKDVVSDGFLLFAWVGTTRIPA